MFERYTEKARRTIFFARYEASQFGSPYIETEHLLLGLLREDKGLTARFLHSHASIESIRRQIEARTPVREKVSVSVELPLSEECKRVLAFAAEEADRLTHRHIGTEHLVLGLLREEKFFAADLLHQQGLRLPDLRKELSRKPHEQPAARRSAETSLLAEFSRDLTQAAQENKFGTLIGREAQLDRLVEILCLRSRNNPVLVGESGVGKNALIEGLALRIASGDAPARLQEKRILTLDLPSLATVLSASLEFEERVQEAMRELEAMADAVVYVEGLFASSGERTLGAAKILKPLLDRGAIQCIAAALPVEHGKWAEREPWLREHFYAVEVPPPSEADAVKILLAIKERYEQFHDVTYSDEAIKNAVYYSERFLPKGHLPDKAIDLMDEAGAAVAVRRARLPEEMADCQKRIKSAVHLMENAIANHQFEKARLYSEEEKKERENLRALEKKYNITPASTGTVGVDEIEEVLARGTHTPVETIRRERRKT